MADELLRRGGQTAREALHPQGDAQRWVSEISAAVLSGAYVDPRLARVTVAGWCDLWLAGYAQRPLTVRQAKVHVKHITPAMGDLPMAAVKLSTVRAWVASLQAAGYADSTIYALHRRLSQVMSDAVHDGVIPRNPL